MELSREPSDRIKDCLPRQRGNVRIGNFVWLNALLYALEHGCKWRGLPGGFGPWHTICTRLNRWSKKGVSERVFTRLPEEQILSIQIEGVSLDSTSIKVQPDGTGARKKNGPPSLGKSRGGGTTKIHLVSTTARWALKLALSPGQAGDAPKGRELRRAHGPAPKPGCPLVMDCAYEGNETRRLAVEPGDVPVAPPNPNRVQPWEHDRVTYRRRNEIERLFRRLKGYRRVCTRHDKLDVLFLAFVHLALIFDALRRCLITPFCQSLDHEF